MPSHDAAHTLDSARLFQASVRLIFVDSESGSVVVPIAPYRPRHSSMAGLSGVLRLFSRNGLMTALSYLRRTQPQGQWQRSRWDHAKFFVGDTGRKTRTTVP